MTVQDVWAQCHMMLEDKWGYIFGASGQLWTQAKQDATDNAMAKKYGYKWIGHRVADCSGVMVYIWMRFGLSIYHGSNTIARKYCGDKTKTPRPGYAAFKWRSGGSDALGDFYHIGIVDENCEFVYESRGTSTGFVHDSPVSKWQFFAPFTQVNYDADTGGGDEYVINYYASVTTQSGKLNVRSGPGTEYPVTNKLNKGEVVGVLMEDGDWAYIVDYNNTNGYVSRKYLTKVDAPQKEDPAEYKYCIKIECKSQGEAEQILECLKNAQVIREMV